MLTYTLYGVFILSCIVMVISVLLQPGKADAGALFTSSVSSAAFGPRGTQSILAKITIFAAASFMITALLLTMGVGGQSSLMEGGSKAKPATAATPAQQASPQTDAAPAQPEGGANAPAANPAAPVASPAAPAASPSAQQSPTQK